MRTKEHNKNIGISNANNRKGLSENKHCPKCKKNLPRSSFGLRKVYNLLGVPISNSYCKQCNRSYTNERSKKYIKNHPELKDYRRQLNRKAQFKKKYKITLEDYNRILEEQRKVCKICGGLQIVKNRKYLYVDHDHKTLKVRGLLCSNCNNLLGCAKDDIKILQSAINYLKA